MNRTGNGQGFSADTVPAHKGYVYFIRSNEVIKIGFSRDPFDRLSALQTSHHHELKILGTIHSPPASEGDLHRKFRHLHIRGEWFRAGADLIEYIARETPQGRAAAAKAAGQPIPKVRIVRPTEPEPRPAPGRAQQVNPELKALARDMRKLRSTLPLHKQYHASNLIEQIGNIHTPEDAERLRPFMARSMRGLQDSTFR